MKKILITIFPLCAILFVLTLISFGLKGALIFLGAVLFVDACYEMIMKLNELKML